MKVCSSCEISVKEFHSSQKEIIRHEIKMKTIKVKLKALISTSTVDTGLGIDSGFWKKIRDEALIGYSESWSIEREPPPPTEQFQVEEDEDVKNVVMDVEVGPDFQIKTEIESSDSESESWERATRQPFLIRKTVEPLIKEENEEFSTQKVDENGVADGATRDTTNNETRFTTAPIGTDLAGIPTTSRPQPASIPFDPLEFLNLNDIYTERDGNVATKRKGFKNFTKIPKKIKPHDTINNPEIKCNLCPATFSKTKLQHHRNLHKGSGISCPTFGIFVHQSRLPSHQQSDKCLKVQPEPKSKPSKPKINPPKRKIETCELTKADLRTDSFFGKNLHDHVPDSFTKIVITTERDSIPLYQCVKCPGRVKKEDALVHQGLHKDGGFDWSCICTHCGIFVLKTELSYHERKECTGNPKAERVEVVEVEEWETDEYKPYYYKCKECSASIKSSELATHLALHEKGSSSRNICIICGWLVSDINQHHDNWHSNNGKLNDNAWALGHNFWVVDASNPNYTIFRKEYVCKFECKKCEAKVFKKEKIEEHVKWHETGGREGRSCESVSWKQTPGASEFRRLEGEMTGFTKYWDCSKCDATCLLEGKVEHQQLHESGDGVSCYACGLLIKVDKFVQHMEYFHCGL